MTKKVLRVLLLILFLGVALLVTLVVFTQRQDIRKRAAPTTTLTLQTTNARPRVGEDVVINVMIDTGSNQVITSDVYLGYDPQKLEVVDITPGTFFLNPNTAGKVLDNTNGRVGITVYLPVQTTPQIGSGTLATILFRAKSAGIATVEMTNETIVGAIGEGGTNVLAGTVPVTVNIDDIEWIQGDINRDEKVDALDYVLLFENYVDLIDQRADINNDGDVNALDYVLLFENFGRSRAGSITPTHTPTHTLTPSHTSTPQPSSTSEPTPTQSWPTQTITPTRTITPSRTPSPTSAATNTFPCTGFLCPRSTATLCSVPNFAWTVGNAFARGGQPPSSSWTCLKQAGFDMVINLRAAGGGYTDTSERSSVEGAGMVYVGSSKVSDLTGRQYAIIDNTMFHPSVLQAMMEEIVTRLKEGKTIFVHDSGGRGRTGFVEATFLMWDGWSSKDALDRFDAFRWKINGVATGEGPACPASANDTTAKGSNGQFQAIQLLALALGETAYDPSPDTWGNRWANCPWPTYMNGWDYVSIQWPGGGGGLWSQTGRIQ